MFCNIGELRQEEYVYNVILFNIYMCYGSFLSNMESCVKFDKAKGYKAKTPN